MVARVDDVADAEDVVVVFIPKEVVAKRWEYNFARASNSRLRLLALKISIDTNGVNTQSGNSFFARSSKYKDI